MEARRWPCPQPGGDTADEFALAVDSARPRRLLIVPALFDEANKLRRLTAEVMRRLGASGIDCFLPDLPGCNESEADLGAVALAEWQRAAAAAAAHFGATHCLTIRGGALIAPALPGWHYAPVRGAILLKGLLRARIIAARELGREETQDGLLELGAREGLELAGYSLSPALIADLQAAVPPERPGSPVIAQDLLGGSPLWLRAEPGEDAAQADALAAIAAVGIAP